MSGEYKSKIAVLGVVIVLAVCFYHSSSISDLINDNLTFNSGVRALNMVELSSKYKAVAAAREKVTADRLYQLEQKYGGFVHNVKRHVLSTVEQRQKGSYYSSHQGGDRFNSHDKNHNYALVYVEFLNRLLEDGVAPAIVAEVGILKGSGIATWAELFPSSNIFGFDIDPTNFENNRPFLRERGFYDANVAIHRMDQTLDNGQMLKEVIGGEKFSFVIDDGCHTQYCALRTFHSFMPHMAARFLYIVEDNATSQVLIRESAMYPGVLVESRGLLGIFYRL